MKSHSTETDLPIAPPVLAATAQGLPDQPLAQIRARAFAAPLLATGHLDTGENMLRHADAMADILRGIGGSDAMQAACYLVYACDHLNKPAEVISKAFGDSFATLALETTQLVRVLRQARMAMNSAPHGAVVPTPAVQTENVRKMLLAFSRDLRVVMLRLASRLQTLRYFAATKAPIDQDLAAEALQVFAPLANRLGIWQIKWEMEDLAFRFLEPETYFAVARQLDQTRTEREASTERIRQQLQTDLNASGMSARVSGRPKHIYSIVKKMRGKSLRFDQVYDLRAMRVVVAGVPDCYAALGLIHSQFSQIQGEFDDYIARPKVNGYQSLHTVVRCADGLPAEIQIRTQAMHDHAENGVAAHWAYKEAGTKGYVGVSATGDYDAKIAVLRQLLAWERDLSGTQAHTLLDDRIYVLTPGAAIVELPQGATAVDLAYSLHTQLGHRCRGARVDGVMVPLNTPLKNGQTVEVTAAKEGGPSRDWLNPDLGYLASHRARAKVRAWFNTLAMSQTVARGREAVTRLLQREGKTAIKQGDLAEQLGFDSAEALFEDVGKDTFSLHQIVQLLRPSDAAPTTADAPLIRRPSADHDPTQGGLLVVGVDSLLTQMAKCCKPAPPDALRGFVTRGRGVSVHRADCSNLQELAARSAERLIDVEWGNAGHLTGAVYPVDVVIQANDRQGLLRDISELFTKEKMNVTAVQSKTHQDIAQMTVTLEVTDAVRLRQVLSRLAEMEGIHFAKRK